MGRKIDIKKIENVKRQRVTFSKRCAGVLKKAKELAILCDAEVAVIIFSSSGKRYEFASSCMEQILARYKTIAQCSALISIEDATDLPHLNALKSEIAKLQLIERQMMGKELEGLSFEELQQLEYQMHESILAIKDKKEQVLLQQHEKSIMQLFNYEALYKKAHGEKVQEDENIPIDIDIQGDENMEPMLSRAAKRRLIVEDVEDSEQTPLDMSKREEIRRGKQKVGEGDQDEAQEQFDTDFDTDVGEGPSKEDIFISQIVLEAIANLNNTIKNLESRFDSHEAFIRERFDAFEMKIEDFDAKLWKKVQENDQSDDNDDNDDEDEDDDENDNADGNFDCDKKDDENNNDGSSDRNIDDDLDDQEDDDSGSSKENNNQDEGNEAQDEANNKDASKSHKDKSKTFSLKQWDFGKAYSRRDRHM